MRESEMERLRRENARLRGELGERQQPKGPLDALARGLGGLLPRKPEKQTSEIERAIDKMVDGAPLAMKLGAAMIKPLARMTGEMFADAAADVEDALAAAGRAIERDERAARALGGAPISIGLPVQQSSSSSSINGASSRVVNLVCPAQGAGGSGSVRLSASARDGGIVALEKLELDVGRGTPIIVDLAGRGSVPGDVIDVEAL